MVTKPKAPKPHPDYLQIKTPEVAYSLGLKERIVEYFHYGFRKWKLGYLRGNNVFGFSLLPLNNIISGGIHNSNIIRIINPSPRFLEIGDIIEVLRIHQMGSQIIVIRDLEHKLKILAEVAGGRFRKMYILIPRHKKRVIVNLKDVS